MQGSTFSLDDFQGERIEYLSSREAFEDAESQPEYIVAISNLLMMTAKLRIPSVASGVATNYEVNRQFLYDAPKRVQKGI